MGAAVAVGMPVGHAEGSRGAKLALQDEHRGTPPRPPDRGRRLVPDQRELRQPHARRRDPDLRGAAAATTSTWSSTCAAGSHLVPRFRQKLVVPPLEAGRPLWADDVNFNLTYHIRHTALPEPGGEAQLKRLAGRVFSQQLDRSKPLWELWLVQGLERDRFAILTKTHHAMVDGISGVDIGTVLFDLEPVPEPADGRRRLGAAARTGHDRAGRARGQRPGRGAGQARRAGGRGGAQPGDDGAQGGRGAGGAQRGRQRLRRPGPRRAAEPADRAAPALRLGALGAGDLQADQGRARRHRQRRRPRRRHRRAAQLAARPRHPHRGAGAAGAGPGLDPQRGRARQPRQPDRADARAAAGLRRGPGAAAARWSARRWRG